MNNTKLSVLQKPTLVFWLAFATCLVACVNTNEKDEEGSNELIGDVKLLYKQPAAIWEEGFPVGNGQIGAMVLGTVPQERISLSHGRLWRENKLKGIENPEVAHNLPKIREMFFAGNLIEATNAVHELLGVQPFSGPDPFQPAGDLFINFPGHEQVSNYQRDMDLSTGIARLSYVHNNINYSREVFASRPDGIIAVRVSADKPASITCQVKLSRIYDPDCTIDSWTENNRIGFVGEFVENVRFASAATVLNEGGELTTVNVDSALINVENADELLVLLSLATDKETEDSKTYCLSQLDKMGDKVDFTSLAKTHISEHQNLFNRVDLSFGEDPRDDIPTDIRFSQFREGDPDWGLASLIFQYGRYLLISSSQPGGAPANLQGIWNEKLEPPWRSDYHHDCNIQMNYWPAEVCNIAECAEPLFDYVEQCLPAARVAARNLYDCRGIYIPLTNDAACKCLKTEGKWAEWTGGAAWLAQHFWWRWEFSGNKEFLRNRAYPLYKEIGLFYQDYLVEDPREDSPFYGKLVTVPSQSPENFFIGGAEPVSLTIGSAMDFEQIYEVFTRLIEASKILDVDADKRQEWQYVLDNIPPLQIGKYGQLQEWLEDYEEGEVHHRHLSHLYGLFSGDQITPELTPELAEAARVALERRYGEGKYTTWIAVRAWMAMCWARLDEDELAYEMLHGILSNDNILNGRLYAIGNRNCQVDGNFAFTAMVAEMLLQSHNGTVKLLPTLPKEWPTGQVRGLRARGGFTVDMSWESGRLDEATMLSTLGGMCRMQCDSPLTVKTDGKSIEVKNVTDSVIEFETTPGGIYLIAGH
ncbi:glycoside hydrolase N-terminal domain-containing protein [Bacteroidota bacterium]